MQRSMGRRRVDDLAKLYLIPDLAHCAGGPGPNTFDVLTPLMAWVETGREPGEIVATQIEDDGTATRTRPVYPYPTVPRYDGSGSTDDAANFEPVSGATSESFSTSSAASRRHSPMENAIWPECGS